MLVLGGLMNQPLSSGREPVSDAAEQIIILLPSNADSLAILFSGDKIDLLDVRGKVNPSFSKLSNSVNSTNCNPGHVGSGSSSIPMQSSILSLLLNNIYLII
jgi:hypothetical protein